MVSVTERVKTLFLSPLQPRNAGGGGGGVGGVSRARFPPGPHICGSRFSRLPPLRQPPTRRLFRMTKNWQFLGLGPSRSGARAPSPCTEAKPVAPTDFFARGAHQEILRNDICFGLWHQLISVRPATPSEVPDGLRDGPDTCRTA